MKDNASFALALILTILTLWMCGNTEPQCGRPMNYYVCDWEVQIYERETDESPEIVIVRRMWNWAENPEKFDSIVFYQTPFDKERGLAGRTITRPSKAFWVRHIPDTCVEIVPIKNAPPSKVPREL